MKYDPMEDLYRKGIDWIFKQGVAVSLALIFLGITISAVWLMWGKMERMQHAFETKMEVNNAKWTIALNESREDWRQCEQRRIELEIKVEGLNTKLAMIQRNKR